MAPFASMTRTDANEARNRAVWAPMPTTWAQSTSAGPHTSRANSTLRTPALAVPVAMSRHTSRTRAPHVIEPASSAPSPPGRRVAGGSSPPPHADRSPSPRADRALA
ncbi:MAG: hypothetical protein HXK03_08570, partial [Schaalia georgiae]|nr:hypothetical protein [Schaalia georgiae]